MRKPPSFNELAEATLNKLLNNNKPTAETLSKMLFDCSIRGFADADKLSYPLLKDDEYFYGLAGVEAAKSSMVRRLFVDPGEFGTELPESAQTLEPFIGRMGLAEVSFQCMIRANLWHVQRSHKISSLEDSHLAIRDKFLVYKSYDDSLAILARDKVTLRGEVPTLFKYFKLVAEGYKLYRLEDDQWLPLDSFDVSNFDDPDYLLFYEDSFSEDGETSAHKLHPDFITLNFCEFNGEASHVDIFARIKAIHPSCSLPPDWNDY